MAADGQIEIDITATTEQFKQALKGLTDQVKRESQGMSQTLSSIGNGLSGFGSVVTAGVTLPLAAAAAAAGKFSFDTIAAAEQASIAFETMLGPEKAKSMLEDLADFAASTPFELQGLETSTQKLIAMGFEAEECIPLLTSIGDAASGLGAGQAGIDQITRALGQMNAKGKVQAEEMMQLTEIGIPAWQYLADVISNGDIPAAMAEVTKGTVSADTAIAALQDGMNKDFGGMMSKQAETLTGVLSNMADAVQKPLMAVKDTSGYKQLTESLSGLSDAIGPFVESLMPHFEKVLKSGSGVVDTFTDALDAFTNMSEKGQADILGLIPILAGVGPVAKVAGAGFNVAGSAVGFLTKEITDAEGKTTTWGKTIKGTASNLGSLKIAGAGLAGVLVTLLAGFAIDSIVSYVQETENLKAATEGLVSAEENAKAAVQGTSDTVAQAPENMYAYKDSVNDAVAATANLAGEFQKSWEDYYTNEQLLRQYTDTIEDLAGKSNLTAQEQSALKTAVAGYNDITGDTVEVIDEANGKLSESTDYIKKNTDEWLANAKAQAYQDKILDLQKQQIDNEKALEDARKAQQEAQKAYDENKFTAMDNSQFVKDLNDANKKLEEAQQNVNSTTTAISDMSDKMAESGASLTTYIGQNEQWSQALAKQGTSLEDISSYLQSFGMKQEDVASKTPDQINAIVGAYNALSQKGIDVNKFASDMSAIGLSQEQLASATPDQMSALADAWTGFTDAGYNVNDFKAQLEDVGVSQEELASLTPDQIAKIVSAYTNGQASIDQICQAIKDGTIDKLGSAGDQGGSKFSSSLSGKSGSAKSAGQKVADAASGPLESVGSNAKPWGSHVSSNFASGISGGLNLVASAAESLAATVAAKLKHSVAKEGPLHEGGKGEALWGQHLVDNLAGGMLSRVSVVEDATGKIANSIAKRMQNTSLPMIELDGQLTSLIIPRNMSAQLAGISAESIIQAPSFSGSTSTELSDGLATIANKLDEVTKRIDQMDKNVSAKLASPVQLKYNRREVGRMQREVV